MKKLFFFIISLTSLIASAQIGNSYLPGNNSWNVYGFTGNNFETYSGYYVDNAVNFNTENSWGTELSPSYAPGYVGTAIPIEQHSFSGKRKGFVPSWYTVNIPGHDDNAYLYIDGVLVWSHLGCCDSHTGVWTGYLDANSIVEIGLREFGGGSYCFVDFLPISAPTVWNTGSLTFTKTAVGQQDCITTNNCLTRGSSGALYNAMTEAGQSGCGGTPGNTQWAYGSIADWSTLSYQNLFNLNGCNPPGMVNQPMVLRLVNENIYMQLTFSYWQQGGGGNFTYTRTTYATQSTAAIAGFTPTSGCANNTSVVITGTNFTGATSVTFGGTNALSYVVNSATQITATVGTGTTGTIAVTAPGGTGTSTGTFTVNPNLTYYADADNDSYGNISSPISSCTGQPNNASTNSTDCDDTRANTHPGASEIGYDLIDNDCDGLIDEGFAPIVTVVTGAQCNTTLSAIDSYVYANLVANAQGYSWRITTMSGPSAGQVQYASSYLRNLRLTQLANYAFNTAYKIETAVLYHGFLQPYTVSSCTVTTPATTTQMTNCGASIAAMTDVIYANITPFATGYRFRVTSVLNPSDTQVIDRQLREFRMSLLNNIQYNSSYNVEVALRNTDGSYLPYGPVCTVATPTFPTTQLQASQCGMPVVTNNATLIYADAFTGAQGYRFLLNNVSIGYSQSVDRVLRTFSLSNFTGLLPGTTYTVKVALNLNGFWGPYGNACTVTVPGAARFIQTAALVVLEEFKAAAYPNPFASGFKLEVSTASEEKVEVKVYDMIGKLVERRLVNAVDLNNVEIGNNYPAGVYNVVVSQGGNFKTVRVIKR